MQSGPGIQEVFNQCWFPFLQDLGTQSQQCLWYALTVRLFCTCYLCFDVAIGRRPGTERPQDEEGPRLLSELKGSTSPLRGHQADIELFILTPHLQNAGALAHHVSP